MKTQKMIVLSGIAMLLLAMMINLNVAIADYEPVEGGPEDDLQVYFLKKTFDFCDDAVGEGPADMPGGAVPDGLDVQTSGCVDRWDDHEQDRRDNYAFTGEQIAELVVARDLDGAIAITHAILQVDGDDVAYCNEVGYWEIEEAGYMWKGHNVYDVLDEYPPQKSESTHAGFDYAYDKLFECFLTVTDDMDGLSVITVEVTDTVNDLTESTPDQTWYFNPAVSLNIETSDGDPISFEEGYAGDTVYSTNTLLLENAAEGGVDIAVWLGGTDLSAPMDTIAKCPYSNILDVEGVGSWEGMHFRCNLDNGLYVEQDWQQVRNKNIKEECDKVSTKMDHQYCLDLNPLFHQRDNVLENGHEAECMFKLQYPVPCIGEFTDGNLIILMRAI